MITFLIPTLKTVPIVRRNRLRRTGILDGFLGLRVLALLFPLVHFVELFTVPFFLAAQRFFCASLIRLRADADRVRLIPFAGLRSPPPCPCNAVIALLRRSLSASNAATIDAVFKAVS